MTAPTFYRLIDENGVTRLVAELLPSPGGSTPGAARVLGPFPFAFDDAGLENGIAIYVPTIGDVLLDAWIEVTTGFDGTTPLADIGSFNGVAFGLWGQNIGAVDLSVPAEDYASDGLLLGSAAGTAPGSLLSLSAVNFGGTRLPRIVPGRFVAADPVLVVASQDGAKGGAAIGGTAGAGKVYLVIATPSLV